MRILYYSYYILPYNINYQEFDEDMGWEDMTILAGVYKIRALEINGWRPYQIFIDNIWIDCPAEISIKIMEETYEHTAKR